MMSEEDSRSRSQSPIDDDDVEENGDSSPRGRRGEKRKSDNKSQRSSGKRSAECRIYVSNIPYEFKWQDLKDLFRSEVGNVAYVEMFNDDSGKPRGSAIVDFETADMAKKAIEKMHRMEAKGRRLVVKGKEDVVNSRDFNFLFSNKGGDRDRNRFVLDIDRRIGGGGGGGGGLGGGGGGSFNRGGGISFQDNLSSPVNYGNTYGLSISFLNSLGINGPLCKKVFVANLDYKVVDDDLREAFQVAGKVNFSEVIKDGDGKSRGFGVVEFDHPVQAVQAISMLHNQQFFDRRINVRLDRVGDKNKSGSSSKLPPGLKSLGMGLGVNGEAVTDVSSLSSALQTSSNNQIGYNMGGGGSNLSGSMNPPSLSMMGMTGMDNMMGGSNLGLGLGASNVLNLASALSTMASASGFGNQGMNMSSPNNTGPMFNTSSGNFGNQSSSNDFNSNFSSNSNRCVVRISNLPMDYTWKNLKDMCRNLGDIKFAEIKTKGVGLVRFSSEGEARRTADMLDRQRFDGRVLDASIV